MSSSKAAFVTSPVRLHNRVFTRVSTCTRRPVRAVAPSDTSLQIATTDITIPLSESGTIGAYLATPVREPRPTCGVVLLSDINGHESAATRAVADRLARHALPTVVPDLFRGDPWPLGTPADDSYELWRAKHPADRVRSDLVATVAAMRARGFANPLGLIGFCFGGGRLMHEISLADKGVDPAVVAAFYPTRFDPVATGRSATCPLFFVSGDQDPLVPEEVVTTLRETLDDENDTMEDCEMIIVEGAGHAFAHHPKSEEDLADSEILLEQATQWLQKYLTTSEQES